MVAIRPTIGRIVYLRPTPDMHCAQIADAHGIVTHAAKIAHVNEDGTLNLAAVDSDGNPYPVQRVPLIQPGELYAAEGPFAHWMPYQAQQAALANTAEWNAQGVVSGKLRGDGGLDD